MMNTTWTIILHDKALPQKILFASILVLMSYYHVAHSQGTVAPESEKPPAITSSPKRTTAYIGKTYTYVIKTTGYPHPECTLEKTPQGKRINIENCVIEWTPNSVGTFEVIIQAQNSEGTAKQGFGISVKWQMPLIDILPYERVPAITSTPKTTARVDQPYVYAIKVTGPPSPECRLGEYPRHPPRGMKVNKDACVIEWTPDSAGRFQVTVTAENSEGTAEQTFTITVNEKPAIVTTSVPAATVGEQYTFKVEATGYPKPNFYLAEAPAGMKINSSTGMITWLPNSVGEFAFTVEVSSPVDKTRKTFTINVSPPACDAGSLLALAESLWIVGALDMANKEFQNAIDCDADLAEAHYKQGVILYEKSDEETDKTTPAIKKIEKAIGLEENPAKKMNYGGMIHLIKDEPQDATDSFENSINKDASYYEAHYNLGQTMRKTADLLFGEKKCEEALEKYASAITMLNKASDLFKASGKYDIKDNRFARAVTSAKSARETASEKCKEIVIPQSYNQAIVANNGGVKLYVQENYVDAIREFKKALELCDTLSVAHFNLANAYLKNGDTAKAIESYNNAIRNDPDLAAAYVNLGVAVAENNRLDHALEIFPEAIELDSPDDTAHYDYGLALFKSDNPDDALEQFKIAAHVDDSTVAGLPEALHNIGVVYFKQGKKHIALEYIQKAHELGYGSK